MEIMNQMNLAKNSNFKNTTFTGKDQIYKNVKQRSRLLPRLMDRLVYTPVEYAEGKITTANFSKNYVKDCVPFFKRAYAGENNIEYRKNYTPEINLIGKISKACYEFLKKFPNKNKLNSTVDAELEKYYKTPIKRDKIFIA